MPLAGRERIVHESSTIPQTPETPRALWPVLGGLGLAVGIGALAVTALWRRRRTSRWRRVMLGLFHAGVGATFGVAGSLLVFMWLGTDHVLAHHNENLLWTHPLTLMALPLGLMAAFGSRRALRALPTLWLICGVLAALSLVLKVLPPFDQHNTLTLILCVPWMIGMVGAAVMMRRALSEDVDVEEPATS